MVSTIDRPRVPRQSRFDRLASESQISAAVFSTALDWMAIAWQDDVLRAVTFGHPSRRQAAVALARSPWMPTQFSRLLGENQLPEAPDWVRDVVARLQLFAEGEPVDFTNIPLSLAHLSPFARRVVAACRRVGWGQVSTYGDLAAAAGSPAAARAVGSVMARNCFPLIVPCHRVLGAGGALGGYSAPDGLQMKKRLLAMEGSLKSGHNC
jgi:methylated-DNA-[protein]-cysteine S-methyltransferase